MASLDFPSTPSTEELAWELQQTKPDAGRIRWLIEDRDANISDAVKQAKLGESDLRKRPQFRPLQKYLRESPKI